MFVSIKQLQRPDSLIYIAFASLGGGPNKKCDIVDINIINQFFYSEMLKSSHD